MWLRARWTSVVLSEGGGDAWKGGGDDRRVWVLARLEEEDWGVEGMLEWLGGEEGTMSIASVSGVVAGGDGGVMSISSESDA